ncbi:S41 family peptidase [Sphingomonas lacunae]|uniref:S41 family peptidase n=2 Tax=Sphingomonas lacunae TaxID=2698828 RepID=A0A6M4AV21_9SPHN|nr:S41 family peptidase [Sphingomonas lacunae]
MVAARRSTTARPTLYRLARPIAAMGLLIAVPMTTSAMATVESQTRNELARFMGVFQQVKANYVEPVSDDALIDGAISGMLTSLDPHSGYLDVRDFANLRTQTDGEYGGLGLSVTMEDGAVKVIAPMAGTPGDRAGIKAGDYITHIDGVLIVGFELDEAVEKMRGRPGTDVRLTVVRPGRDEPMQLNLTREEIQVRPVTWEVRDNVGVLTLSTFSARAAEELRSAMVSVERSLGRRPAGWILDLRSNPGGLLDEAVNVSDLFLERGEIVSQRGRRAGDVERYSAHAGDAAGGLPVIVLIDAGSASASEIVAGALQDQHRALIMGETSFGKGSVQTVVPLSDTTALRLTTARYYTPSGRSVQEGGIVPDIRVPQISDPDYRSRPVFREADLRRHLVNETAIDNRAVEEDTNPDPRFSQTAEQVRAQGIEDFQLHYALQTVTRLANNPRLAAGMRRSAGPAGRGTPVRTNR